LRRLEQTLIRHLEHVFSPPGLPLVPKSRDALPTTSIVVRGGPGVGKTTLAMALALTVARENRGAVVYLSTEIAPVDARTKATDLGVSPERVGSVKSATAEHEVLVDHLAAGQEAGLDTPEERTEASLRRIWERVLEATVPVAAVVVDSFLFVGAGGDKALRAAVMDLIVALEARGVCPILVEEAPAPEADWLGYLVDLIFELEWAVDPDLGARYRRLGVPKSRFVEARPGPHDYGRTHGLVVVWPLVTPGPGQIPLDRGAPAISGEEDTITFLVGNGISYSPGLRWLRELPWVKTLDLDVRDNGPNAFVWRAIDDQPTLVVLRGRLGAADWSRFRVTVTEGVRALVRLGFGVLDVGPPHVDPQLEHVGPMRVRDEEPRDPDSVMTSVASCLPESLRTIWLRPHGACAQSCAAALEKGDAPNIDELHTLLAGIEALHLGSIPALAWLDRQDSLLARVIRVPAILKHRGVDDALSALEGLPLSDADRSRAERAITAGG
jgi:KaiC/GvpD/RAD55 family RecA-like ATPase